MTPLDLSALRKSYLPPCPVFDVHVHPLRCFSRYGVDTPALDAQRLLEAMRTAGIHKACLFALAYGTNGDNNPQSDEIRSANDHVLRMRDHAGESLLPFCFVNPISPTDAVNEIDRCIGQEHMVGIKLWISLRATDKRLDPIMERATELGVPVLQHAWLNTLGNGPGESYPSDVADMARRHPSATIIMAHMYAATRHGLDDIRDTPNVVVDVSGSDPESGMLEYAIDRLGSDRIVYGSDWPIRHFSVSISKVLDVDAPRQVIEDILWNNTARLLPEWANVAPLSTGA